MTDAQIMELMNTHIPRGFHVEAGIAFARALLSASIADTAGAIRREALEQAAAIAEGHSVLFATMTAELIAKEIRALIAATPASSVADPTDPGHDVETLREHIRHLERRLRQLHAATPSVADATKPWRAENVGAIAKEYGK
jgi:hypothetical protein